MKYDVGSVAMFDTSEKQRGPSWCDRILFRSLQDKLAPLLLTRIKHGHTSNIIFVRRQESDVTFPPTLVVEVWPCLIRVRSNGALAGVIGFCSAVFRIS
jgi:hypothetical protein